MFTSKIKLLILGILAYYGYKHYQKKQVRKKIKTLIKEN